MSSPARAAQAQPADVAQQIADALRDGNQAAAATVKLPMPTYDGKAELLKSFLKKYEAWCTVSRLTDVQAAETAQFALTGEANIWFLNQADSNAPCVTSWAALRTALQERFTGKLAPGELAVLLDSLTQKPAESVQTFVDRIHRVQFLVDEAAEEAGPALQPQERLTVHDNAVCMQFLRGMKKSLRRVVCAREQLTTLKDYVNAAKAAESAERDNPSSGAAAAELSAASDALEALNFNAPGRRNAQGGRGRGCGRARRPDTQNQDGQRISFASTVCYNCNKVGHISTFCPSNPNSSANRRPQGQGQGQQQQQQQRQGRQQGRGRGGRQQRGRRNNQQQPRNFQQAGNFQADVCDYNNQQGEQQQEQDEYTEEATLSLSGYSDFSGSMQDFFE